MQPYDNVVPDVDLTFPRANFQTDRSLVPYTDNLIDPLYPDEIGTSDVNAETDVARLSVIPNNGELVLEPDVIVSPSTPLTKLAETPPNRKEN